jgi:Fe-S cluster assembly protein SufD
MSTALPLRPLDSHNVLDNNWLSSARQKALRTFEERGFPSKRHEAWKYTSIGKVDITPLQTRTSAKCKPTLEAGSYVITLVDGELDSAQSRLPDAFSLITLDGEELSPDNVGRLQKLHIQEDISDEAATQVALNFAKSSQALLLHIPKGEHIDGIIEIHHVFTDSSEKARYTQLWLHQEPDTHVTLLERFYGAGENEYAVSGLQNHVSYIQLEKGAQLSHYRLQDAPVGITHLYTARLTQADHSEYRSFTLTTGASLSRQEIQANLFGTHIRCDQQGVTFGRKKQHHDAYLPVTHHRPESYSNQHFRQLLDDQSRGIFYGSVSVPESSINTEAHQLNHNILLSPKSQAFTRPELDIFTDDVVCSHGATVGNLDEQALYYLQTRGLDKDQAKHMLVKAFAEEMLDAIMHISIKELMLAHIKQVTMINEDDA